MPAKFEVRDNHQVTPGKDDVVAVEYWPSPDHTTYSSVWAMSTDDARDLYVTLGTFLEDE